MNLSPKNGSGTLTANTQPRTKSSSAKSAKPRTPAHGTRSYQEKLLEWIDETFEVIVYPTGFEDCIVGVGERFGGPPVAVLDIAKMLAKLEKEGMTHDEAIEYFEFNILGTHVGEQNPVYMHVPDFKMEKPQRRKGAKAT
jgi:hypothetical protein